MIPTEPTRQPGPARNPNPGIGWEIDRTLHALGHMEAPGLEDRILASLEAHTAHLAPLRPVTLRPVTLHPRTLGQFWATLRPQVAAAASLAIILFSLMVFRTQHHAPPAGSTASLNTSSPNPQQAFPTPQTNPGARSSPALDRNSPELARPARVDFRPTKVSLHPPTFNPASTTTPSHFDLTLRHPEPQALTPDQQALVDLQTPSFPAPPLPPTAQERLVRLMLRRGEKRDLAQLDPTTAANFAQQERQDFLAFFDPPTEAPKISGHPQPTQGRPDLSSIPTQLQALPNLFPSQQGDPQ